MTCAVEKWILYLLKQPAGPDLGPFAEASSVCIPRGKRVGAAPQARARFPYSLIIFVLLVSPPHWSVPRAIDYLAIKASSCNRSLCTSHSYYRSDLNCFLAPPHQSIPFKPYPRHRLTGVITHLWLRLILAVRLRPSLNVSSNVSL